MGWQHSPWVHWLYDACGMAVTFLGHTGLAAPTCINATACTLLFTFPHYTFTAISSRAKKGCGFPKCTAAPCSARSVGYPFGLTEADGTVLLCSKPVGATSCSPNILLPQHLALPSKILIRVDTTPWWPQAAGSDFNLPEGFIMQGTYQAILQSINIEGKGH